jgi:type IV pilus assembly protein PilA
MDFMHFKSVGEKTMPLRTSIHAASRPALQKCLKNQHKINCKIDAEIVNKNLAGFSAIEMMVVVAIIAILAAIAIPSSLGRIVKEQVSATIPWSDAAKEPIAAIWKADKKMPADNTEAGLPAADKMVSNFVTNLSVENGAIHMTLGNKVHPKIAGKILSIRPAVVADAPIVPIAWVCGNAKTPDKMTVIGANNTTIPDEYLPHACR